MNMKQLAGALFLGDLFACAGIIHVVKLRCRGCEKRIVGKILQCFHEITPPYIPAVSAI